MIARDQMQIFVINMPEDTERLRSIDRQLKSLGLEYERFPAVVGKDLSVGERSQHLNDKWFYKNEGRHALRGDLGVALSHLGVYREIVDRRLTHALILEDDAWLNPNLPELLQAISEKRSQDKKEMILLTWFKSIHLRKSTRFWAYYHLAHVKSAFGGHGYVISQAGAKTLIDRLYPVRHVVDCWNWLIRHRVLDVMVIFPTCITVDMSYEVRTTPNLDISYKQRPWPQKFGRKAYRAFWNYCDLVTAWVSRLRLG